MTNIKGTNMKHTAGKSARSVRGEILSDSDGGWALLPNSTRDLPPIQTPTPYDHPKYSFFWPILSYALWFNPLPHKIYILSPWLFFCPNVFGGISSTFPEIVVWLVSQLVGDTFSQRFASAAPKICPEVRWNLGHHTFVIGVTPTSIVFPNFFLDQVFFRSLF